VKDLLGDTLTGPDDRASCVIATAQRIRKVTDRIPVTFFMIEG
jgi:hypothetical protein